MRDPFSFLAFLAAIGLAVVLAVQWRRGNVAANDEQCSNYDPPRVRTQMWDGFGEDETK